MKTFYAFGASTMLACVLLFGTAMAQKEINGGVLNGKAVSLPKPHYPDSAKMSKASGAVAVNVVIDESGTVISAEADPYDQRQKVNADGTKAEPVEVDQSLRDASVEAALQARFSPTMLSGVPVQVKGRIVYNFVADVGDSDTTMKAVSGGVLNGKAVSLPAPVYPAAALAVNAAGAVTIQVMIDEGGNVIEATAVSGHPLLRAAAIDAARQATFSPTLLNGSPVRITGVITYNFVAPKKDGN